MIKNIFSSKTLWFNAVSLAATGTSIAAGTLSAYPNLTAWLVLFNAAANIILRLLTKSAVTVSAVAKG